MFEWFVANTMMENCRRTKKKDIFVISTLHRPVPLEFHLYVPSAKEYFQIVDSKKNFVAAGVRKANEYIQGIANQTSGKPKSASAAGKPAAENNLKKKIGKQAPVKSLPSQRLDRTTWIHLVGLLQKRDLLPVVMFTFSKKKCEEYADCLEPLDLLNASEKSEVHVFVEKALIRLRGDDRLLPQILRTREMLSRGIGVHHGGLLPLVKEMVEILFSKGLVKVLYATETFAMGVNMPTKCVVFSSVKKHDGRSFRELLPGEFTQMSGRAGRRGLDTTGLVLLMCLDAPEVISLQTMILGKPTKLESQFRLTYNMILNLLRVEALNVEEMMKRSFSENSAQKMLPDAQKEFAKNQKSLEQLNPLNCLICSIDLAQFYDACCQIEKLRKKTLDTIWGSPVGAKALSAGRVVLASLSSSHQVYIGVTLSRQRSTTKNKQNISVLLLHTQGQSNHLIRDSELKYSQFSSPPPLLSHIHLPTVDQMGYKIMHLAPDEVLVVTRHIIPIKSEELQNKNKYEVNLVLQQLRQFGTLIQNGQEMEYDWSKIRELEFQELYQQRRDYMKSMIQFQCVHCPDLVSHVRYVLPAGFSWVISLFDFKCFKGNLKFFDFCRFNLTFFVNVMLTIN
jgi:antiviral helicase SKI2